MADAFQPKFVDLVRNNTSTTGIGNFVLGPPVTGHTSFTAACAVGESFYYSAISIDKPAEHEVGRGTLLAGGIVDRDPIGGTRTNFSNGPKTIALIAASEWFQAAQALIGTISPFGQSLASSADADAARTSLGVGSAGLEAVARFPVTLPDRAALAGYSASSTAYLRETGREGLFVWSATDLSAQVAADGQQGIMVAPASDVTGISGAWVRSFSGPIDPRWFGIVANDSSAATKSANATALTRLISYLAASGTAFATFYVGTTKVQWPEGTFYFAAPNPYFSVKCSIEFEGVGSHFRGPATRLYFDKGGFLVEAPDTVGGLAATATLSGGGSQFRKLYMTSLQQRPPAASYAADATSGILSFAPVFIADCAFEEFTRDGITLDGTGSAGVATNVDTSVIEKVTSRFNGRHGIFLDGIDANACSLSCCDASMNNNWGIYDSGFLNNTHVAHHTAANGVPTGGTKHDGLTSVVCHPSSSGTLYSVAPGQSAAASTTTPGINGNVWVPQQSGAGMSAANSFAPAWVSGTAYKEGGAYFCDGVSSTLFVGCYSESGQGQPFMGAAGIMLGGAWEKHPLSTGFYLIGSANGFLFDCGLSSSGALRLTAFGTTHQIGPVAGSGTDVATALNTVGNGGHKIQFNRYNSAGTFQEEIGYVWAVSGGSLYLNGRVNIPLRINGGNVAVVDSSGIAVTGAVTTTGAITSSSGGVGYATGAGGAAAQATGKSNGVTLNKACGQITMNAASLAAGASAFFTVSNSEVAATDTIDLVLASGNAGAGTYNYQVDKVGAGSFTVWVKNVSAGALSEALVFNFSVTKAVAE